MYTAHPSATTTPAAASQAVKRQVSLHHAKPVYHLTRPHRFQTLRERYDSVTTVRTFFKNVVDSFPLTRSTPHRCTQSTPAPSNARPKKKSVSKPRSSAHR